MWLLALGSRSEQIAAAARILCANWVASVQIYLICDWSYAAVGYALIELATAAAFLRLARGRVFPLPLVVIHALLVAWHVASLSIDESKSGYLQAALNRIFDFELIYIGCCAAFRIRALNHLVGARRR